MLWRFSSNWYLRALGAAASDRRNRSRAVKYSLIVIGARLVCLSGFVVSSKDHIPTARRRGCPRPTLGVHLSGVTTVMVCSPHRAANLDLAVCVWGALELVLVTDGFCHFPALSCSQLAHPSLAAKVCSAILRPAPRYLERTTASNEFSGMMASIAGLDIKSLLGKLERQAGVISYLGERSGSAHRHAIT